MCGAFYLQEARMAIEFVTPKIISHPHGYELPDLPYTPIDESTGLPWCFAPNPNLPPIPTGTNENRDGEWNHMFPKVEVLYGDNPVLDGLGRMALLNLRHQWVEFNDHHYGYNPNYIGPLQPATHRRLAATVIMGLAGFVPEYALNFKNDKPTTQRLAPEERRILWESGQLKVASEGDALKYLGWYIFEQDVDHIRPTEIDEFLHTFNLERRIHLGHCLTAKIIERAIEPVDGIYAKAYKQGALAIPDLAGKINRPPKSPRDLVKHKLTSGRRFGSVYNELHRKLGAHRRKLALAAAV
jgi:hypothetical protein